MSMAMDIQFNQQDDTVSRAAAILFRQSLAAFGGQWRRVVTGSMYPFVGIGDWIYIESIAPEDIRRGMLVVFYRRNDFVVHRILAVDKKNGYLIEKGDGLPAAGRVCFPDVIGKVTRIRKGQAVVDLETGKMRRISMFATLRSRAHLFWVDHCQSAKASISNSLPAVIRTPLHRVATAIRKIFCGKTPFPEKARYEEVERMVIGNNRVQVSVAPDNRDIGQVVHFMREKNLDAVMCLFSQGVTESLLRYFLTIEYPVILFDRKGCLTGCVEQGKIPPPTDRNTVAYIVLITQRLREKLDLNEGSQLKIEGIL
jgi:signal peptidase I